jgi:ribosome recycling factor
VTPEEVLADAAEKMRKAVDHTTAEFGTVRTGRASPAFVEKLTVDYYGTEVPMQQLAGFSVPEARTLVVQPYDAGAIKASSDGKVLRINFPPLTAERRKDYVKMVKHMAEEGRVAVRNLRRAARHELEKAEKDGEMSADDLERAEKELEKITSAHVHDVDAALEHKERELTEV